MTTRFVTKNKLKLMYGYQLQSASELKLRISRIPNNTLRAKAVKTALRYFEDTHPPVAPPTPPPFADRLKAYQVAMGDIMQLSQNGATEKEIMKSHRAADRLLSGKTEKTVSANTTGTRTVLFYINHMVEQRLTELARTQPEICDEYTNGSRLILPIKTSTRHLCKAFAADLPDPTDPLYDEAVTTMTASFRGKHGYYARLLKMGYLDRKENQTRLGNTEQGKEGQEVVLYVNVGEWVFGWNDVVELPSASFSNDTRGNSSLSSTIYGKEHKQREAATAAPRVNDALFSAQDSVKGTNRRENPAPGAEESAVPNEAAPGGRDEKLEKLAYESLKLMLAVLFNQKNAEKGLIRTNETTLLNALLPKSIKICEQRLIEIYAAKRHNGTTITQTNIQIAEIVKKIAHDLDNRNLRYVYAPEMWLRMDYEKATLWNYLNPNDRQTTTKPPIIAPKTADDANVEAWLIWLEEKGLHRQTIEHYAKKHGKTALAQAANFAQLALDSPQHTLKIKTTIPQYLHGILRNLNPQRIHIQIANLIEMNTPKPGHIWANWCNVIAKNTNNRRIIQAFESARSLSLTGNTMTVQLSSINHFKVIDSAEAIAIFKIAMQETGVSFKINYELRSTQ